VLQVQLALIGEELFAFLVEKVVEERGDADGVKQRHEKREEQVLVELGPVAVYIG
jgi:hypothetical protein